MKRLYAFDGVMTLPAEGYGGSKTALPLHVKLHVIIHELTTNFPE